MSLKGEKHLIDCRCVLSQFKNLPNYVNHKFVVFSILDEETDKIQEKYVQCNNCGVIHKVTGLCRSEIMTGFEHSKSIITIDEIKLSLSKELNSILENYDLDLPTLENAKFIVENKLWGQYIILTQEVINDLKQGKYLQILGERLFKVETFSLQMKI